MFALCPTRSTLIWSIFVPGTTSSAPSRNAPSNGPKVSGAAAPRMSSNHSIAWLMSGTVIPTWSTPTRPSSPLPMSSNARAAASGVPTTVVPSAAAPPAMNLRRLSLLTPPPFVACEQRLTRRALAPNAALHSRRGRAGAERARIRPRTRPAGRGDGDALRRGARAGARAGDRGRGGGPGLGPGTGGEEVGRRQALTAEAVALLDHAAEPSLHGIPEIREAVEHA